MGRHAPLERIFLAGCFAAIALVAAFAVFSALIRPVPCPHELEPVEPTPQKPPRPPPEKPLPRVILKGRVIDIPGFDVRLGILGGTRVCLRSNNLPLDEEVVPDCNGAFVLERAASLPGLSLRVSTQLRVKLYNRTLDRVVTRDLPVLASDQDFGDILLPRSKDFGSVEYTVVDTAGHPINPESISLDSVEGTSTPDVGIARLDDLHQAANAPTEYRRGGSGTILHVPPGEYWLRASAQNRLMPAVRVTVGRGPSRATLAELASERRVRGIVRDSGLRRPLEDVEITVCSARHAGASTRDPARVLGVTTRSGAYDLPLPDPLPPGGVRVAFVRYGYRGSEVEAKPEHFKGGTTILIDLDLGPN